MNIDVKRFNKAIEMIDALNQQDPDLEEADGNPYPKALLYSARMTAMLDRYAPNASEALQLAARCQHIERWKIARDTYPMTKAGYYQWRTALKAFHAEKTRGILQAAGYDDSLIAHVCALVMKALPSANKEAQILEDVVVLVFLESYLEQFVNTHANYDAAKFADILTKTLKKVSPAGRYAAMTMITMPLSLQAMLTALLHQLD